MLLTVYLILGHSAGGRNMSTPSFLRRSIKIALGNLTFGPSGGQVYPPVESIDYYTYFNGTSYGTFTNTTLSGDFFVSCDFTAVTSTTGAHLFSTTKTSNGGRICYYNNGTNWRFVVGDANGVTSGGDITDTSWIDGGIHFFMFDRINANEVSIYIDNGVTPVATFTDAGNDYQFNANAKKWSVASTTIAALTGYQWNLNLNNQIIIPFNEPYGDEIVYDSVGNAVGTYVNRASGDVTSVEPS